MGVIEGYEVAGGLDDTDDRLCYVNVRDEFGESEVVFAVGEGFFEFFEGEDVCVRVGNGVREEKEDIVHKGEHAGGLVIGGLSVETACACAVGGVLFYAFVEGFEELVIFNHMGFPPKDILRRTW